MTNGKVIDFSFEGMRTFVFLKKPYGAKLPDGHTWKCPCTLENRLTQELTQNCSRCGTRLKIQERREDPESQTPNDLSKFTIIRIAHMNIKPDEGEVTT